MSITSLLFSNYVNQPLTILNFIQLIILFNIFDITKV